MYTCAIFLIDMLYETAFKYDGVPALKTSEVCSQFLFWTTQTGKEILIFLKIE